MALRGNGTLRADPRVSSSAEDVARIFCYFFTIKREITFPNSFARYMRGSSKGREGNASSLTGNAMVRKEYIDGKGREHELEEPRSPSYEKNSQMLSTQYYQSSIHKRATRFAASLKKVTSNLAKNYYAVPIYNVNHEKRDERTMGTGGIRQERHKDGAYINLMRMLLHGQSNRE